jgi:tRNA(fMet)-specific endonuclease VapC
MIYMLDSDVCISIIRERGGALAERLYDPEFQLLVLSSVTFGELMTGVEKSQARERNEQALKKFCSPFLILPFDEPAAMEYARIRAVLERAGKTIGPMDLLIAGHARALGATLITRNTREFYRVAGLNVETW